MRIGSMSARPHAALAAALAAALVLAGCATGLPQTAQPALPAQGDALLAQERQAYQAAMGVQAPGYDLMLASGATELGLDEVTASSVKNDYFRLAYATDGNTHSAWGPDPSDPTPTLSYTLTQPQRVTDLKVKLSPAGVTMTIRAKLGSGAWQTIASNVSPSVYEDLVEVSLPPTDADQLQIVFNKPTANTQVLVCETHFFGLPVPAPSCTPTPPQQDCGFKMEGAGAFLEGLALTTFALEGVKKSNGAVSGFVSVCVKGKKYLGDVRVIQQQGHTVTMSGPLLGTGQESFTAVATDNGRGCDNLVFTTSTRVDLDARVKLGFLKFIELPCKFPGSSCKSKCWGRLWF